MLAWAAWIVSLVCVLASHFFGSLALRKAVTQLDSEKIRNEPVGGAFDRVTQALNVGGGVTFVIGAILAGFFVFNNLE